MIRRLTLLVALSCLPILGLCGCSQEQQAPLASPSTDSPAYASRYPDTLASARGRFSEDEGQARTNMGKFGGYPDELDKPNWPDVLIVYDKADAAGHSSQYVERAKETKNVANFFNEEKAEINKKVAGACGYAAKQKGCDADVGGATGPALEKAVEKQLEKRMRERNEAWAYIDEHEDSLGKQNREKLEKQSDDIAYTSYLVRVHVEETKREMDQLITEGSAIKSTLDKTIEDAKKDAADPKRSDAEKKKAQAKQEAAEKAKARVDQEIEEAQKLVKDTEERMKTLRDEYTKAFDELKKKAESKSSGSTEGAKPAEKPAAAPAKPAT